MSTPLQIGSTFGGSRTVTDMGHLLSTHIVNTKPAMPSVEQFVNRCNALVGMQGEMPVRSQVLTSSFWPGEPIRRWSFGDGSFRLVLFVGSHGDEPVGLLSGVESAERAVARTDIARILETHAFGLDIIALDLQALAANEAWFIDMPDDPSERFDVYVENFWRTLRAEDQGEWSGKVVDRKRGVLATKTREACRNFLRELERNDQEVFAHLSTHGSFFWSGGHLMTRGMPPVLTRWLALTDARFRIPFERGPREDRFLRRQSGVLGEHYEYRDHVRGARGRVYHSLDHVIRSEHSDSLGMLCEPPLLVPQDVSGGNSGMAWQDVHELVRGDLKELVELFVPLARVAKELTARSNLGHLDPRQRAFVTMMASVRVRSVEDLLPDEDDLPGLNPNGHLTSAAAYAARFCHSANFVRLGGAARATAHAMNDQRAVTDIMAATDRWKNKAFSDADVVSLAPWQIAALHPTLLGTAGDMVLAKHVFGLDELLLRQSGLNSL
jgi:hypothetical protein